MCVYVCTCMYVYVCVCMYVRGERTRMIRVRITERWVFSYKKSYVIFPVKYQIFIFCNCQCCVLKKCQKNARLLKYAKRYFSMPNALKKCQIWVIWHFKCQPGNPGVYVCTVPGERTRMIRVRITERWVRVSHREAKGGRVAIELSHCGLGYRHVSCKHVSIIDSEQYCILHYLFCLAIINAVAVFHVWNICTVYYFLIFIHGIIVFHAHSLLRYSCFFKC